MLSQRRGIAGIELVGYLAPNGGHFAAFGHIGLIDESTGIYSRQHHLGVVGLHAVDRSGEREPPVAETHAPVGVVGGYHFYSLKPLAHALKVCDVEIPGAALGMPVVRLGGTLGPHYGAVCREAVEVAHQQPLGSSGTPEQKSEHGCAPEYTESGKKGARLITCERGSYLFPVVGVEKQYMHFVSVRMIAVGLFVAEGLHGFYFQRFQRGK